MTRKLFTELKLNSLNSTDGEAVFTLKPVTVRLTKRDEESLSLSGKTAEGMDSWSSPGKAALFINNGAQRRAQNLDPEIQSLILY